MSFSPRNLILLGLGLILLIAIPLTIYLVQQQQETRSGATPSTVLSVIPATKTATIGAVMDFDVVLNPGTNIVNGITLEVIYDSTKIATDGAGFVSKLNNNLSPNPVYSPGKISVSISPSAADPTQGITTTTTIATLSFKAIALTSGTPTEISFGQNTVVTTTAGTDENTNVLANSNPARITIVDEEAAPTATITPTTGAAATATPTPTTGAAATATPTPTTAAEATATVTPIPTEAPAPTATTAPVAGNTSPVCSALTLSGSSTGTAPYALTFTATGTDADGTISKVSFDFGDGVVQDLFDGSGIGTSSVNAQMAHTYNNAGTFNATAVLTDDVGGTSQTSTCSQTITVTTEVGQGSQQPTATPVPTLAPTGPAEVLVGIGVFGIIAVIIGSALLFIL